MVEICCGSGEPDLSILDSLLDTLGDDEPRVEDASVAAEDAAGGSEDASAVVAEPDVAVPVPTPAGYGEAKYLFPANDAAVTDRLPLLSVKGDDELLGMLKKLVTGRDSMTGEMPPYARVRPFVIAISMILNERQVCPPRFRPRRKVGRISKGIKWGDEPSMSSNDRQVLDLHWLACSGSGIQPSGKWAGLLSASGLHFDLASEFVATVGDAPTKVSVLGLHQGEIRQLAVLQPIDMKKRWADLEASAESLARPRLREWREKQKGRAKTSVEELLLHYLVLGLVKDSPTEAARLASLVTGSKVSATTMSRRFDLFQRLKLLRRASS